MASQLAALMGDYQRGMRRTDPSASAITTGMYAYDRSQESKRNRAQGEIDAVERGRKHSFENSAERRKVSEESRKQTEFDDERKKEQMGRWLGPVTAATTNEKWIAAQTNGFIPKGMPFAAREPFMMYALQESDRLAREKQATTSNLAERKHGLEGKKFQETMRKNKADDKRLRETAKMDAGLDGRGVKTAEENAIAKIVDAQFGDYDPVTKVFVFDQVEDKRKAQRIKTRAAQLAKHNPGMTLHRAATQALEEAGSPISNTETGPKAQGNPLGWQ
jgi:hypothetical protein